MNQEKIDKLKALLDKRRRLKSLTPGEEEGILNQIQVLEQEDADRRSE